MATYPNSIFSWTNRINGTDVDWAQDPNSLAAEIIAIETNIGPKAQVETRVPVGSPVAYTNVSARISDAMLGTQHPYVFLYNENFNVPYGNAIDYGVWNSYRKFSDKWGYFNGTDITVQATGLYAIDVYQAWEYYTSGYLQLILAINGTFVKGEVWSWNMFPTTGPSKYSSTYGDRWANTGCTWIGTLNAGDRVRVASENSTSKSSYNVINSSLKMVYLQSAAAASYFPTTGQRA